MVFSSLLSAEQRYMVHVHVGVSKMSPFTATVIHDPDYRLKPLEWPMAHGCPIPIFC